MTTTTTLITFRVRCPPSTRRVELLGSWDNFSQPYPMQRDSRIGKEHWRGCHSFKNIICDGDLDNTGSAREGGLKMGGTYWYYYQLDDDIEFHNSAEPSTTSCPLLPGQLVNVLHVPYHFSGSGGRDRNGSVSSTSSDLRTMDPEMKFLNPRPAPLPKLPRLKTSPPLLQKADAFDSSPSSFSPLSMSSECSGHSYSVPSSATSQRRPRLPRRPFEDRSQSTSPTKQGFLATLKQFAVRAGDADRLDDRTRAKVSTPVSGTPRALTRTSSGRISKPQTSSSRANSREHSPSNLARIPGTLAPIHPPFYESSESSDGDDEPSAYLFRMQRRNRSRSREPSPLRNSLVLTTEQVLEQTLATGLGFRPAALDTLQEAPSQQASPIPPVTPHSLGIGGSGTAPPIDSNKRLPTLPNSPSSAYETSLHNSSPSKSVEEDYLHSHFSAMTVSTTTEQGSSLAGTVSGMYGLTDEPLTAVPSTMRWGYHDIEGPTTLWEDTASKNYHADTSCVSSMPQTPTADHRELSEETVHLPSENSSSTISSHDVDLVQHSSNSLDLDIGPQSVRTTDGRRHGHPLAPPHLFQYRLPLIEEVSVTDKPNKAASPLDRAPPSDYSPLAIRRQDSVSDAARSGVPHSSSMQQLMDELSYLGSFIKS